MLAKALEGDEVSLMAWDATTGEELWSAPYAAESRGLPERPVALDGADGTLVLNTIWTDAAKVPAGAPLPPEMWGEVVALDLRTGEAVASYPEPLGLVMEQFPCPEDEEAACLYSTVGVEGPGPSGQVEVEGEDRRIVERDSGPGRNTQTPDVRLVEEGGTRLLVQGEASSAELTAAELGQPDEPLLLQWLAMQQPADHSWGVVGLSQDLSSDFLFEDVDPTAMAVTALDPADGSVLWSEPEATLCAGIQEAQGYVTGSQAVLVCTAYGEEGPVRGLDPATGDELWSLDADFLEGEAGRPVTHDGLVALSEGGEATVVGVADGEPVDVPATSTICLGPVTKPGPMGDYRISLHTPCTLDGGPSQDAPIVESLQTLDGEQEIYVIGNAEGLVAYRG